MDNTFKKNLACNSKGPGTEEELVLEPSASGQLGVEQRLWHRRGGQPERFESPMREPTTPRTKRPRAPVAIATAPVMRYWGPWILSRFGRSCGDGAIVLSVLRLQFLNLYCRRKSLGRFMRRFASPGHPRSVELYLRFKQQPSTGYSYNKDKRIAFCGFKSYCLQKTSTKYPSMAFPGGHFVFG